MTVESHQAGMAALAICEALLLAMNDQGLLPEHEIRGLLHDAAVTHRNAVGTDAEVETHKAVAELIDQIIVDRNTLRRL